MGFEFYVQKHPLLAALIDRKIFLEQQIVTNTRGKTTAVAVKQFQESSLFIEKLNEVKKMSVKLNQIILAIEALAPEKLAEDWDNVGLQVGSRQQIIKRMLLTLDITAEVVDEAVKKKVDLIIAHHPFIFNGLKTLSTDWEKGQSIEQLIKK